MAENSSLRKVNPRPYRSASGKNAVVNDTHTLTEAIPVTTSEDNPLAPVVVVQSATLQVGLAENITISDLARFVEGCRNAGFPDHADIFVSADMSNRFYLITTDQDKL